MAQQRPEHRIARLLDTNGDGSGTDNAIDDYDTTPTDFYFEAQEDTLLYRMIISIGDTAGARAVDYGNINNGLANGWELKIKDVDDTVLSNETGGVAVKNNGTIARNCYDADIKTWGSGDELVVARWTFSKDSQAIFLRPGQKLVVHLSDDCTGLLEHYFFVKGELLVNRPLELGTENY